MIKTLSFSGKGKRENNEDYILSHQFSTDRSIHLLADGMGGYQCGDVAALLVCETISRHLYENLNKFDTKSLLTQSVARANKELSEKRKESGKQMGTTIAGVFISGSQAFLFWLGDVRIYHFRNDELRFQSEDHSLINEMKKRGHVSFRDFERYGNIVTRSINGEPFEEELDIKSIDLLKDDTLILCSDGFWQNFNMLETFKLPLEEINNYIENNSVFFDDNYSILRIIYA
jgi:serine/threonine protein phosphatase PrpC